MHPCTAPPCGPPTAHCPAEYPPDRQIGAKRLINTPNNARGFERVTRRYANTARTRDKPRAPGVGATESTRASESAIPTRSRKRGCCGPRRPELHPSISDSPRSGYIRRPISARDRLFLFWSRPVRSPASGRENSVIVERSRRNLRSFLGQTDRRGRVSSALAESSRRPHQT